MSETRSQTTPIARPAGGTTAGGGQSRLGLALLVLATAQLMVVLDATIVNVALPHIQRALGFSGSGLEWVVNAYALAFGGLLLLPPRRRGRFDLPGALTGTGGIAALVYGLVSAATSPNGVSHWGDAKVIASLAAATVLLAAFAVIETRSPQALLPIRLQRAMTHTQRAERVLSTHWAVILDASSQAWTRDVNGLLTQASAVALAQTMRASGQTAHVQATVTTIIDYAS